VKLLLQMVLAYGFASALIFILDLAAKYKTFEKMGLPGWKALIPVYNQVMVFDKVWDINYGLIMAAATVLGSILSSLENSMLSTVGDLIMVAVAVLWFLCLLRLSKAFGRGAAFALGLLLLSPVFFGILGFGQDQFYVSHEED